MSVEKRTSCKGEIHRVFKRGNLSREEYRKFKILSALNKPNANMGTNQIRDAAEVRKNFLIACLKEFFSKQIVFKNKAGKYSINPDKGVALLNDLKAKIGPDVWEKIPFYNALIIPHHEEALSDGNDRILITSTVAWNYGHYDRQPGAPSWKEQAESRLDKEKTTESRIVKEVYPVLLEIFGDKVANGPVKIELLIKRVNGVSFPNPRDIS